MTKDRKQAGKASEAPTGERYEDLKRMLVERQREIVAEIQGKIRDVRNDGPEKSRVQTQWTDGSNKGDVQDTVQEDIEFALIQMKAETLEKINQALARLEEGTYGNCFECGDEIAQPRLRAIPFAVRCKDCEEAREIAQQRERIQARRGSATLGFDFKS